MAWASARFTVVCSDELLAEYEHVLSRIYIRSLIYPESLRAFRDYLVDEIELIELGASPAICRDPDDDKVIAYLNKELDRRGQKQFQLVEVGQAGQNGHLVILLDIAVSLVEQLCILVELEVE